MYVCMEITVSVVISLSFHSGSSRRSHLAYVSEQPLNHSGFHPSPNNVRPNEEAAGKPESVSAEPAGPVPVPAIPVIAPTNEDGPAV